MPKKIFFFITLKLNLQNQLAILPPTRAGGNGSLKALVKADTRTFCLI
jgi:hypothetical protein